VAEEVSQHGRREAVAYISGAAALFASLKSGMALAADAPRAAGSLAIPANSKLLMIGDSITDCDRARPIGEGSGEALGHGYVSLVAALLTAVYPEHPIRVVNQGISANTVRDLNERWQTDVLDLKPDWVSVMIGTNDVWRQFKPAAHGGRAVLAVEYETTLDALVVKTLQSVKGMVLMTPFYLEPSRSDPMRAAMDHYGVVVKRIATARGALFVDTQAAFEKALSLYGPIVLSRDRVHPTQAGHVLLARAFLNALGFNWNH
jgi:lysophospholipase L1-like esterase